VREKGERRKHGNEGMQQPPVTRLFNKGRTKQTCVSLEPLPKTLANEHGVLQTGAAFSASNGLGFPRAD
jgi:hypothetical protein